MLFDVQSALAEILRATRATSATAATTGQNVASVAGVAARQPKIQTPAKVLPFVAQPSARAQKQDDGGGFPHGVCDFTDRPRTWTGKVVALDEWRRLSDWEREGSAGQLWCGVCSVWVPRTAAVVCRDAGTAKTQDRPLVTFRPGPVKTLTQSEPGPAAIPKNAYAQNGDCRERQN